MITFFQSVDDHPVLCQNLCHAAFATDHRRDSHDAYERAQLFQESERDRELRPQSDLQMELFVEFDEILCVSVVGRTLLSNQQESEIVNVLDRHAFTRFLDDHLLKSRPNEEDLTPPLRRYLANDDLSPGANDEEFLLEQPLQSVSDWRT
jgi:hypothetical protein